ncbi:surface lipoprotein assembly modifier [Novosphingobium sp. RD2P27]|uniref:Surface lipoprotein assembly modifier n=1 Tax=Novosphingobium kalidii TaxID=3230299 RepID=A0ABV2D3T1_9SPHN
MYASAWQIRLAQSVGGAFLCLGAMAAPTTASGQATTDQDTRIRLDQQIERQKRDTETELLEDADPFGPPTSLEIDGQTYAVDDNVHDMGKALYISVERQQWQDARRFLAAYERFPDHDPMLVHYAKGGLARQGGDLGVAEQHYRELLTLQPGFLLGQLELSRVLFENRKDREARRAFESARALLAEEGDKAAGVRRTVDAFLNALKRRRGWQGTIAIGPSYSTNLNQSSASYTCLLEADDGTCLFDRKVPDPIKAAGINFEATLGRDVPLGGHHGIRVRGLLFGDVYPDHHDYSQVTAIARIGYQHQTARHNASLSPSFELGSLGSSVLYDAPGVNAEWTYSVSPRAMLRLEGNYRDFRYRLKAYDAQSGPLADINLTGWYSLSSSWTLFGGPDFAAKDTDDPVDSYRQLGVRVGVNKAFGERASLLLLGSYRHRKYRAYSELFEAQREDDQFNATAIARVPALKFAGLVPELVVQHNRIKSNIDWLYSYDRTTASLRLSHAF